MGKCVSGWVGAMSNNKYEGICWWCQAGYGDGGGVRALGCKGVRGGGGLFLGLVMGGMGDRVGLLEVGEGRQLPDGGCSAWQ